MASFAHVPGPWKLKASAHIFFMYNTSNDIKNLNESFIYDPLEANSKFTAGKHVGGLSAVYVLRYHDSPVGPYDEMMVVPGFHEYEKPVMKGDGTTHLVTKKNLRVTRIFVSTKESCYNGRRNWNIPKHLAKFEFKELPGGVISLAVFAEEIQSTSPFFRITYKPIPFTPTIPASTSLAKLIGLDLTLVQPPLPNGDVEELPGTDDWCSIMPFVSSRKTSLEWCDLKQKVTEEDALLDVPPLDSPGGYENWWPGLNRWKLGLRMEDATVDFPAGEHWKSD